MRRVVFSFSGRFETHGGIVFAKCDHASLVAHGIDEDQALERMDRVMEEFVRELERRGEIEAALQQGRLRANLGTSLADRRALINREGRTFVRELAEVA